MEIDLQVRAEETARRLVGRLSVQKHTLALAESCTGGLISELITRVSGASAVLWGSFVCYSPSAKKQMLCIDGGLLDRFGLVSAETVRDMARKALEISGADISAAVTGLAGPDGDGGGLPPGTVWAAVAVRRDGAVAVTEEKFFFRGLRAEVKMQAAAAVLEKITEVWNI